jgi:hypothetical protein
MKRSSIDSRVVTSRHSIERSSVDASSTDNFAPLEKKRSSIDSDLERKRLSVESNVYDPWTQTRPMDSSLEKRSSLDSTLEKKRSSIDSNAPAERSVSVVDGVEIVELEPDESPEGVQAMGATASRSSISSSTVSTPGGRTGKISFSVDEAVVHRYSFQEPEAIFPVHGHWLPTDLIRKRKSFEEATDFAKALGGRVIHIDTGIEEAENLSCVLVEPMGKILSPSEYVSTGVVICVDGGEHEAELLQEWGEVLKATKWLDAGISFAFPDVSGLAEVDDLEVAVSSVLQSTGFSTCLLVGKGWGAKLTTEMAGRTKLAEKIDGCLLVAPESPVPSECGNIEVPVMLVWAEDDEDSPFSEIREWFEELDQRRAPTFVKDLKIGGHCLTSLLQQGETAQQVLYFVVCSLLMVLLVQATEQAGGGSEPYRLPENCARLCDELPPFLASQVGGDAELGVAHALSGETSKVKRKMNTLVKVLREWIRDGMQEMASATE